MEENNTLTAGMPVVIDATVTQESFKESKEEISNRPDPEVDLSEIDEHNEKVVLADDILSSCKERGFEETLLDLAEGNLDEEESGLEIKKSEEEIERDNILEVEEEGGDFDKDITNSDKEILRTRINELEAQIADLKEKNQELFQEIQRNKENNETSNKTLLALALALYELAKKEEDEGKKVSLLDIIFKIISLIITEMFDLDESKNKKMTPEASEKKRSKVKDPTIEELMAILKERGGISKSQDVHPHPSVSQTL